MRGFFLAMMMIAMMIVSILILKNLNPDGVDEVGKMEVVQDAKDLKQEVDAATQKMVDQMNQAAQ